MIAKFTTYYFAAFSLKADGPNDRFDINVEQKLCSTLQNI